VIRIYIIITVKREEKGKIMVYKTIAINKNVNSILL
jgi:hypothetical protein